MFNFIWRIREKWNWFLYRRQLERVHATALRILAGEHIPGEKVDQDLKKLNAMRHKMERGE